MAEFLPQKFILIVDGGSAEFAIREQSLIILQYFLCETLALESNVIYRVVFFFLVCFFPILTQQSEWLLSFYLK